MLVGLGISSWQTTARADTAPELKFFERIVFLGDSITAGGVKPNGYVTLVQQGIDKKYKDRNIAVFGAGISGNKVPNLQARLDKDVLALKPSVVVIYIGINDVWHGEKDPARGTTPEVYEAGLKDLIARITKIGARVLLCTPTVIGEKSDGTNSLDARLDAYAEISRRVARETGTQLCDLRKAFIDHLKANNTQQAEKGILTTDRVHLNGAGNRLVADEVLKALGV